MCMSCKVLGVKKGRKEGTPSRSINHDASPPATRRARTLDAFLWESLRSPFRSSLDSGLLNSIHCRPPFPSSQSIVAQVHSHAVVDESITIHEMSVLCSSMNWGSFRVGVSIGGMFKNQ